MDLSDCIISLTGFMGSGKTSVGRELATRAGFAFVDLDDEILAACGRTPARIIRAEGEQAFRRIECSVLRDVLDSAHGRVILALGGGTILTDEARELILSRTRCIFLDASEETILRRTGADTSSRPLFNVDLIQERLPFYRQAHYVISTDGLDVSGVVDSILERKIV